MLAALTLIFAQLEEVRVESSVMGTTLEIKVWHQDLAFAQSAVKAAEKELRRVEDLMTDWRASPLEDLNSSAGQGFVSVDKELCLLLARAQGIAKLTSGAFDPSFGAVGKLWKFKAIPPVIPSDAEIANGLVNVGWNKYSVDLKKSQVELSKGVRLGLGGIAKGYGVDCAMSVLMEMGIEHAIVNAGGDLKALGKKYGSELWNISIRHPRDQEKIIARIPVSNTCIVTSGDYEQFFLHNANRFHHILDPRTGYPATGCMSATVIAQDAAFADALATALCVLSPEAGLEIVNSIPRVEALVVDMQGQSQMSKGLKNSPTQ